MRPFPTSRRLPSLTGLATLGAAVGFAALGAILLGWHTWHTYLGLFLAAVFGFGRLEKLWTRRRQPSPRPRMRSKLRAIRGGKAGYDLAKDDRTNNQKYVM
jgi:hypothetical protein